MMRNKSSEVQRFFDMHTGCGFEVAAGAVVAPSALCVLELTKSFPDIWERVDIEFNPSPLPEEG